MHLQHYIILDAAKMGYRIDEAKRFNDDHKCLYKGDAEQSLYHVAPWLFTFELDSSFAEWYLASSGQQNWGIIVESEADMKTLYLHFKKFLWVQTEFNKKLYFRFYDPRVLPTFLETSELEQLTEFYGPVHKFIIESNNGQIMEYELKGQQLQKQPNNLFKQITNI